MESKYQHSIKLLVDSKEIVYDIKETLPAKFKELFNEIRPLLLNAPTLDIFRLSRHSIKLKNENYKKCLENPLLLDSLLAQIRSQIKDYWGYVQADIIHHNSIKSELLCRCHGIGETKLANTFIELKGDIKKVYMKTNAAGACGSCFNDVESFLNSLETQQGVLFSEPVEKWENLVNKLIDEYYFVCPPEFSNLKFKLISISSRGIKIKCTREGTTPGVKLIQESLNNFFKGELPKEIPISVFI